ncbi:MAG: methylenetetrahydrofolate reductase C-terminal domain-containing protein [Chloroflexi bacterium]|nr:methylenetetrahydrofolate reductase C-terminal domain-containing protein [Chloroflexota bacterium]
MDTLAHPQTLRSLLTETTTFTRIAELVPTRGPLVETDAAKVAALANDLAGSGIAHALSITDNAGGAPKVSPESLGMLLEERKQQAIIHLSCKDINRCGLESRAWALASAGFENLLCLSGDYPVEGYRGQATAVFDVDSVGLITMLHEMNQGLRAPTPKDATNRLRQTQFYLGCAVSPFKLQERELMPQYYKLARKIAGGAGFVITQLGYDSRKFDELLRYMELKQLNVPVIANIYLLSRAVARYFNKGMVAGAICSDALLAEVEKQFDSPDKGKAFFREFAAKQIAVLKGLGYRGVYLSGPKDAKEFEAIFDMADSFAPDDWKIFAREIQYPQPNEFYFFEQDPDTSLSSSQINREYLASLTPEGQRKLRSKVSAFYKVSRMFHGHLFDHDSRGFAAARGLYSQVDSHKHVRRWMEVAEQAAKIPLYDCRNCGDCSLPDVAYLCPVSQCSKNQRNGPCGGSHQGICEATEKDCIWARAYERLKPYGEAEKMLERPPVFRDGSLRNGSSWANTFLGRDHFSKHWDEQ